MKSGLAPNLRALAIVVFVSLAISAAFAATQDKQQSKDDALTVPEGERKAIEKIKAASGVSEKLKASAEYLKKNGKSQARPRVAVLLLDARIGRVGNGICARVEAARAPSEDHERDCYPAPSDRSTISEHRR